MFTDFVTFLKKCKVSWEDKNAVRIPKQSLYSAL